MKCVCRRKCQVRDDQGSVHLASVGKVMEFKECPPHFESVDDIDGIDFLTATEDELMHIKWTFDDACAAIEEAYSVELKREDGTKKSEIVSQILDARFRAVD